MNRLREFRLAAGLSQAAVARVARCTEQTIYYLERDMRNPSLGLARRIARAVKAPVEVVFPPDDEPREEVLPSA